MGIILGLLLCIDTKWDAFESVLWPFYPSPGSLHGGPARQHHSASEAMKQVQKRSAAFPERTEQGRVHGSAVPHVFSLLLAFPSLELLQSLSRVKPDMIF